MMNVFVIINYTTQLVLLSLPLVPFFYMEAFPCVLISLVRTADHSLPFFMSISHYFECLVFGEDLLIVGDCVRFLAIVDFYSFEPFLHCLYLFSWKI